MINKIRSALDIPKQESVHFPFPSSGTHSNFRLLITRKNYKFKTKIIEFNKKPKTRLDLNSLNSLFVCTVLHLSKIVFKFDFTDNLLIKDLILFLQSKLDGNPEFMFLQVENKIFAENYELIKESLSSYAIKDYIFSSYERKFNFLINPESEIYFYDGGDNNYNIKIERIHATQNCGIRIRDRCEKTIICRACAKNISTIMCIDDPICPKNEKYLCTGCFNDLYRDINGELKFKDIKYTSID